MFKFVYVSYIFSGDFGELLFKEISWTLTKMANSAADL